MVEKGLLRKIEEKVGLPPLEAMLDFTSGEKGKRFDSLLKKIEKLSQDAQGLSQAIQLLELVERLDDKGTLARLNELLKELTVLSRGKAAQKLLENIDKIDEVVKEIAKV